MASTKLLLKPSTVVFIVGAKRTAFGSFGGSLLDKSQDDLGVVAMQAAMEQARLPTPSVVDSVVIGNVVLGQVTGAYLSRHVALRAGADVRCRALNVNRLCGSGFESLVNVAKDILLGEVDVGVAGGVEHMSHAPFASFNSRWGIKLGHEPKLHDVLWSSLTDSHINTPMGMTAEKLAEIHHISRADCDNFALRSQKAWAHAEATGLFNDEICPVPIKTKKGIVQFQRDEHPRPDASIESLAKLPSVFKKDGVVTAGNASGICDGAGALVLASEKATTQHNLKPLARVVGWHISGVDPSVMGIGPVPAINGLLKSTGMTLDQIDLVEINEAFAAQFLACQKSLNLNLEITNCEGGAIALGHPLGASGSRILTHLTHMLHKKNKRYAIGSACIGGGQGIAVLLERV